MDEQLANYRAMLIDTLRFLNEAYDKILVTLAGGALGLSIIFLKDIVQLESVIAAKLLVAAWVAFIISLSAVLGRILFGIEAYRKAIRQIDDGSIRSARVGGYYSAISRVLHIGSAMALVLGLISLAIFSYKNVGV